MSTHLERCIRSYVAQGANLDANRVRPGNTAFPRGSDPFATLLLITNQRRGSPHFHQLHDRNGDASGTLTVHPRRATYSLQFYREGASDLAETFDRWAQSEIGLLQATTSFASANGAIRSINVINQGSGYVSEPSVSISGPGGSGAVATASISNGEVTGIVITNGGSGYVDVETITIEAPTGSNPETATASAIGYGMEIVLPLTINRLDSVLGDKFEERSQIDLTVDYSDWSVQQTGGIDENKFEVIASLGNDADGNDFTETLTC